LRITVYPESLYICLIIFAFLCTSPAVYEPALTPSNFFRLPQQPIHVHVDLALMLDFNVMTEALNAMNAMLLHDHMTFFRERLTTDLTDKRDIRKREARLCTGL
jgi:hypothetical protein